MKRRKFLKNTLLCGCSVFLPGCSTVPVTGRSQLNIVPESMIKYISDSYYYSYLDDNFMRIEKNEKYMNRIYDIGLNIEKGIKKYFELETWTGVLCSGHFY